MLTYMGTTSPECLLHPGEALNLPFHAPASVTAATQQTVSDELLQQKAREVGYFDKHRDNPR